MFQLLVFVVSTSEVIQRCCNLGKAFYEAPIMTYKAHKRLYFGVSIQGWTLSNRLQVLLRGANPFSAYMVGQIVDLRLKHIALRWLQVEAMLS